MGNDRMHRKSRLRDSGGGFFFTSESQEVQKSEVLTHKNVFMLYLICGRQVKMRSTECATSRTLFRSINIQRKKNHEEAQTERWIS